MRKSGDEDYLPQGLTSNVTIDFAAGFSLPSFFFLYAARFSSLTRAASTSSSLSEPNRSTSSSSSSSSAAAEAGASLGFSVASLFSGP